MEHTVDISEENQNFVQQFFQLLISPFLIARAKLQVHKLCWTHM